MEVGSNFYRDISKIEKKVWGISFRLLKAILFFILIFIILLIEVFFFPDWAFMLFALPTALGLGYYPMLLILNRWPEKRRKIELNFIYEDRFYQSGQIRRYDSSEFIQAKNIKETDII